MRSLLQVAAGAAAADPRAVQRLAGDLLALRGGAVRSCLNNDGSPLQVCLEHEGPRTSVRLIADPGADRALGGERLRIGGAAFAAICGERASGEFRELGARTISYCLPAFADPDAAQLSAGALWLGAKVSAPDLALYTQAAWGDPARRWPRARRWLRGLMARPDEALALIDRVEPFAESTRLGLEGTRYDDARLELHWRLRRRARLEQMGLPALASAALGRFFGDVVGGGEVPASGLIFGAAYSLVSGHCSDVKLDVCAHCVPRPLGEWRRLIARHGGSDGALTDGACQVAFVGLGIAATGTTRLNVCLKIPDAN